MDERFTTDRGGLTTERLVVDAVAPASDSIARAAAILRDGGLVAFPTETVYGLGARADDAAAVARIYAAKGRPAHNPLIVHVVDVTEARAVAREWPRVAEALAEAFWPGPLTIVVPRGASTPSIVSAGGDTIALRAPRHPVAIALLRAAGFPVAAPSANRSNELSPTRAEHVLKGLDGRIDALLDGGTCDVGIESTVIDVTGATPRLLRPGTISIDDLRAIVGDVVAGPSDHAVPAASPGLERLHYAPRATLEICSRSELVGEGDHRPTTATIAIGTPIDRTVSPLRRTLPREPLSYARLLFETLHALDDLGAEHIVVEEVPTSAAWDGVRDRLARASAK